MEEHEEDRDAEDDRERDGSPRALGRRHVVGGERRGGEDRVLLRTVRRNATAIAAARRAASAAPRRRVDLGGARAAGLPGRSAVRPEPALVPGHLGLVGFLVDKCSERLHDTPPGI